MGIPFIPKVLTRDAPPESRQALAALLLIAFFAAGCGRGPAPIIVFGSPDSPRLRQAVAGLEAKLAAGPVQVAYVPQFGPQGRDTLRQLRQARPRLLVVLGTPALMLVTPVVKRIPVVFGLVADPYFTGAAYEPAHPEIHQENVTGIVSPPPLAATLQLGASLLGHGSWGLLYDPTDGVAADLARDFQRQALRFGIMPLTETSTTAATDGPALEHLVTRGARVVYLPPAASAARYAPLVLDWGRHRRVMVVSSYPAGSHAGAVLWVALDYHKLGKDLAALARRVLHGEAPASIPLAAKTPLKVEVDEDLVRYWSGYPPAK
jgi:ABC-type uncharacterized transport system substrate-binding protein